jgi:hypothetical protein
MMRGGEGRGGEGRFCLLCFALLFSARRPWCWCDCDSMISEDNLIYIHGETKIIALLENYLLVLIIFVVCYVCSHSPGSSRAPTSEAHDWMQYQGILK